MAQRANCLNGRNVENRGNTVREIARKAEPISQVIVSRAEPERDQGAGMTSPSLPSPHRRPLVVVGQGYVGLPGAMRAGQFGFSVIGLDVDAVRVWSLKDGKSYVDDVSDNTLRQ